MDDTKARKTLLNAILDHQTITLGQLADLLTDGDLKAIYHQLSTAGVRVTQLRSYKFSLSGKGNTDGRDRTVTHGDVLALLEGRAGRQLSTQMFSVRRVTITDAARAELGNELDLCITILARHQTGDWEETPVRWRLENHSALRAWDDLEFIYSHESDAEIVSVYSLESGTKLVVCTAGHGFTTQICTVREKYSDSTAYELGCSVPCFICKEPIEPGQSHHKTYLDKLLCRECAGFEGTCTTLLLAKVLAWHVPKTFLPTDFDPGHRTPDQIPGYVRHNYTNYHQLLDACRDLCGAFKKTCGTSYCKSQETGKYGDCLVYAQAYGIINRVADSVARQAYETWREHSSFEYYDWFTWRPSSVSAIHDSDERYGLVRCSAGALVLTRQQVVLLIALATAPDRAAESRKAWLLAASDILELLDWHCTQRQLQSAAEVLAKKPIVDRSMVGRAYRYQLTEQGHELISKLRTGELRTHVDYCPDSTEVLKDLLPSW